MQKFFKISLWYLLANTFFILSLIFFNQTQLNPKLNQFVRQHQINTNIVFASIPNQTVEIKTAITSQDARPVTINRYLKRWGSPLEGMGDYIVKTADKYQVDPYLIIAIAQQESNLGKKVPPHCFNAWGWGIHSQGTLCFDNWYQAIDVFAKGLAESYYAYGLKTPDQIMTKYVPHSPNGAWAKGVNQFLQDLKSGNF